MRQRTFRALRPTQVEPGTKTKLKIGLNESVTPVEQVEITDCPSCVPNYQGIAWFDYSLLEPIENPENPEEFIEPDIEITPENLFVLTELYYTLAQAAALSDVIYAQLKGSGCPNCNLLAWDVEWTPESEEDDPVATAPDYLALGYAILVFPGTFTVNGVLEVNVTAYCGEGEEQQAYPQNTITINIVDVPPGGDGDGDGDGGSG